MGITEQEALTYVSNECNATRCRYLTTYNKCVEDGICFEVKKICIKVLEKQIPKKPNDIHQHVDHKSGYCPSCNTRLAHFGDMNFCHKCGIKLDWNCEDAE